MMSLKCLTFPLLCNQPLCTITGVTVLSQMQMCVCVRVRAGVRVMTLRRA